MATTEVRPAIPASPPGTVPAATPSEDAMTAFLGTLFVVGILTDAWAHNNIVETLEGFFTPWHALLYGGFAATAGWTCWLAYRRREVAPRWWRDGWPAGYRVAALGMAVFMVGGLGDMFWHEIFGVEIGLDALLSPTHFMLVGGGALLVTSPLRSLWAQPGEAGRGRVASAVVSMAMGTTIASVFLMYGSAFATITPTTVYDPTRDSPTSVFANLALASYVVTTALLALPVLLAYRRRTMPGAVTAVVAAVGLFHVTTREFESPQTPAVLCAIGGAVLADLLLMRLDAVRGLAAPLRLPLVGAALGALVMAGHLVGLQLAAGIKWPIEMWSGTPVLAALIGALLGGLAARPAEPR